MQTALCTYPYRGEDRRHAPDAEGYQTLRGGSWDYEARDARCAYRPGLVPDFFGLSVGFRVVVSLALF
jgi:formylglycine-generating enzyme required for sulfatase activity